LNQAFPQTKETENLSRTSQYKKHQPDRVLALISAISSDWENAHEFRQVLGFVG
jgi:hypothetical protein